jgi:hypothetical protein
MFLVRDTVPKHAIDHVTIKFRKGSDSSITAGFAALSCGDRERFGVDNGG